MTGELLWVFAILLGAYFVRGLTGFGSGLIAVPLMAMGKPLQFVVPLVMTLDFVASFILGGINSKQTNWAEIRRLLPFGLIGAMAGLYALTQFPSALVLASLGLFTVFFGARNALGIKPEGRISALWALPTGLVGSGAGALFGTSAPPYIIYLTHRLEDKTEVRATFSWLFVLDGGFRLALFVAAGLLLREETLWAIALGLIPMLLGLYLGNRVHLNISKEALIRVVGVFLVGTGMSLIFKVMA
jgi:uncharacterized membrane protein YfcA